MARWLLHGGRQNPPVSLTEMISFDARDLELWAGTHEARSQLPELVRRLILATTDRQERSELRFPSGSSVDQPGWDGWLCVSDGNTWVPAGQSGWEGSCEKGVKSKAQSDYENRLRKLDPEDAKDIEFVFVTPRLWGEKESWVKDRRGEGVWANVRVIDADDLIAWLDDAPAVAVWFAAKVNKPVDGLVALDLFWESWSGATSPKIKPELVIAGRTREQELVGKWSNQPAGVLSIRADTESEAIAFVAACARAQCEDWGSDVLANAVVVETLDAWRRLEQQSSPTILVRAFDSEWSPGIATERGHSVVVVLDTSQQTQKSVTTLSRLGRAEAIDALQKMGLSDGGARSLMRQTARRLEFIRWKLIDESSYAAPDWRSTLDLNQIPLLALIGMWEGDKDGSISFLNDAGHLVSRIGLPGEGDVGVVARIAGTAYEGVEHSAIALETAAASPIARVGSRWRIVSREQAWHLVANRLNSQQIARFKVEAIKVLSALSPALEMNAERRFMAPVVGRMPAHSDSLRQGLATTLVLMAVHPDRCPGLETDRVARQVVHTILSSGNDWRIWASLDRLLPQLAEVAPDEFLDALELALSSESDPFESLFGESGDGFFAPNHYAPVLWSLDLLSWSADHFGRVALVLARLAEAAPSGLADGPGHHLEELFVPDLRFTDTTDEERLSVLEMLLERHPGIGWSVLVNAATRTRSSMNHRHPPDWRPWGQDLDPRASRAEISAFLGRTYDLLLDHVDHDIGRWLDLLRVETYSKLPAEVSEAVADRLLLVIDEVRPLPSSRDLWDALRRLLHENRKYRDAPWSIEPAVLNKFEDAYSSLTPEDPADACVWLFAPSPAIPNPPSVEGAVDTWQIEDEQVQATRRDAIFRIWEDKGLHGITDLVNQVAEPATLGLACAEVLDPEPLLQLATPHFGTENDRGRSFVQGALHKLASASGWEGLRPGLEKARESTEPLAVCDVFLAADSNRETWDLLADESATAQAHYWRNVKGLLVSFDDDSDAEHVVSNFLLVGRSWDLVVLRESEALPTKEIVSIVDQLPRDTPPTGSELGHAAYKIGRLLAVLDRDDSVTDETIAGLELHFIRLLEHHRSNFAINRLIASNPAYFVEFVSAAYRRDDDSSEHGVTDAVRQNRAILAHTVLDNLDVLPGAQLDGSIDHEALASWVSEARRLCEEQGRGEIGDSKIGELLSGCAADPDGLWPCAPVRDLLDSVSSEPMARGFNVGKANRESAGSFRSLDDGGKEEREIRDRYLADASRIRTIHPFTSRVLRDLADSYDSRARYQDSEAEWRDLSV